jgi:hypothetical protein
LILDGVSENAAEFLVVYQYKYLTGQVEHDHGGIEKRHRLTLAAR